MAIWLALIVVVFLTRNRWEAWQVEWVIGGAWPRDVMIATKDGRRAATGGVGGTEIWDTGTGTKVARHGSESWADVSPLRTHVILRNRVHVRTYGRGSARKYSYPIFKVVDLETGSERFTLGMGRKNWAYEIGFTTDGKEIVTSHEDDTVRVWDVATGEARIAPKRAEFPSLNRTWPIRCTQDGSYRTTGPDGTARTLKLEGAATEAARNYYTSARPLPDGRRVTGWNTLTGAKVWDARTGETLFDLRASGPCCPVGDAILVYSEDDAELRFLRRIRPEQWWGVFFLWHFWLIAALAVALATSILRDVAVMRRERAQRRRD